MKKLFRVARIIATDKATRQSLLAGVKTLWHAAMEGRSTPDITVTVGGQTMTVPGDIIPVKLWMKPVVK